MQPPPAPGNDIADLAFRRGMVGLRVLILLTYVALTLTGVLDIRRPEFLAFTTVFALNTAWFTWMLLSRPVARPIDIWISRHFDVVLVTVLLVTLRDVENPAWAVYFISLVGAAYLVTRREMIGYGAWIGLNYLAAAVAVQWITGDVSWARVTLISVLVQLMGLGASLLAGGEQRVRDVMQSAASTDSLTGLPNRHAFHARFTELMAFAEREATPVTLMMLDVDHFKEINDRDGHPAGDDKLQDVAAALRSVMRRGDIVARYGGDEFVVLAPQTGRAAGHDLGERLRDAAMSCDASLSVGVALFPDDAHDAIALIAAADAALYRAKQAGRNCVRDAVAA